jgi:hypothetical protein
MQMKKMRCNGFGRLGHDAVKMLMVGVVSVVLGCSDDNAGGGGGLGDPCDLENPCQSPLVCSTEGRCVYPSDAGTQDGGLDASVDAEVQTDGESPVDGWMDAGLCEPGEIECGDECCTAQEQCYNDTCIPDQGGCATDNECQEDSYCEGGICVPYGSGPRGPFNPECTRLSVAGLFQPSLQCAWTAPPPGDPYPDHQQVLSTPMVVDFDFDDDPANVAPSIVVMTYNCLDGDSGYPNPDGSCHGVVRVLDGETCTQLYNVGNDLNGCNPPALADLDGDGRAEIIVVNGWGRLQAYTYEAGTDSWTLSFYGHNSNGDPVSWSSVHPTGWAALSVHDLDDDGAPEILSGGLVYDASGLLLDSSLGLSGRMYSGAGYPVAADLDVDGLVELATGEGVYAFDPATRTWNAEWSSGVYEGYVAVADFGTYGDDPDADDRLTLDGVAEIAIVRSGSAHIMSVDGRVFFSHSLPGSSGGGPPTVGDFDGDGLPEFAAAGSDSYTVFDPDCTGLPDFNRCYSLRTDGILWTQDSQDHSSNRTGSSLFDFEGDGRTEAIYADEVFARVYDGRTGEVVFSTWTSSCTWNENPIVADVDGDFNAELVVPSNQNCTIVPRAGKTWSAYGGAFYETSHRGNPLDPLFRGLRCEENTDCSSGVCDAGYCRCTTDDECGGAGSGFVCDPPPASPMSPTPGSGNTCRAEWLGQINGIRVYQDVLDRWVGSRLIWNQHTYAVTNVEEDGTVPATSSWTPNWQQNGLNNFRQNVQGSADVNSSPDVTGGQGALAACESDGSATLSVQVCNRGTDPVAGGVPVTFYEGGTADGIVICTSHTAQDLYPGQCEEVTCVWSPAPPANDPKDVTIVVDDDGTGGGATTECVEGNNMAHIDEVYCDIVD